MHTYVKSLHNRLNTTSNRIIIMAGVFLLLLGVYGIVSARGFSRNTKVGGVSAQTQTITDTTNLLSSGQWSYMAGSTVAADGLHINDDNFSIVEQDGSGGQPNPPVNLYGTHLGNVKGDFTLHATASDIAGQASLRLYAKAPIVADEFRVEPPSIELVMSQDKLTVNTWDGASDGDVITGQPSNSQTFPAAITDKADVSLSYIHGNINISVSGVSITTINNTSILHSGNVWFGATSTNGDYLLSGLTVQPLNNTKLQLVDTSTLEVKPLSPTASLAGLASQKRPGFLVGAALSLAPSVSDSEYAQAAFGGNFSSMTTENALKWQFSEPQKDVYDFHEADALVALAKRNNMAIHGHTLVFGEANPAWVTKLPTATSADKAAVQKVMTDHINTVVGHYKGQIATWDVVNEPLADYDNFDSSNGDIYRTNTWYDALGSDYIATAFRTAHTADPSAKLFVNEYGLESDGDRWDAFLSMVTKLKSQGVPIDGVGFESHVYESEDKIDTNVLKAHMQQLAALGLVSRVSEIDVYDDDGTTNQAKQFSSVFTMCLNEPSCVSFTTWGVSDRYDMYQEDSVINYGNDLLWDNRMRPTKALTSILDSLRQ